VVDAIGDAAELAPTVAAGVGHLPLTSTTVGVSKPGATLDSSRVGDHDRVGVLALDDLSAVAGLPTPRLVIDGRLLTRRDDDGVGILL
jgi:hypothetical protein